MGLKVNFFLSGYPKCGTTAIYEYLKDHGVVGFPEIKEPHFYTSDFPGIQACCTASEYQSLFSLDNEFELLGDASASVIHSDVAVDSILSENPDAKFVVLLREPLSAVRSFHGELLHNLNENVEDFELAWRLQADRCKGSNIPKTCIEPKLLQYREVFNYREQLPKFFSKVPAKQRLVLVFEEFFANPRDGYCKILEFLSLNDDGRTQFEKVNVAKKHRFLMLAKLHRAMVLKNGLVYRTLKMVFSGVGIHPSHLLARFNKKSLQKVSINEDFERELVEYFRPDVEAVETLLGRKIDSWRP